MVFKKRFKTFCCIILINILSSLHNFWDYDFYESPKNRLISDQLKSLKLL